MFFPGQVKLSGDLYIADSDVEGWFAYHWLSKLTCLATIHLIDSVDIQTGGLVLCGYNVETVKNW